MSHISNADLGKYPADIRPIVEVLFVYESELSDGYEYHFACNDGFISHPDDTIIHIAREIKRAAKQGESNE